MRTVDIIRFGKMMYVGEECQVLVSVLKVFCAIARKMVASDSKGRSVKTIAADLKLLRWENQIQSLSLHLIQLETMLIRL